MGRSRERPFRFIWNKSKATAANVYLLLYPKADVAQAMEEHCEDVLGALRAIGPDDFFRAGRVYGGGLHKMEPAELMRIPTDQIAEIVGVKRLRQIRLF